MCETLPLIPENIPVIYSQKSVPVCLRVYVFTCLRRPAGARRSDELPDRDLSTRRRASEDGPREERPASVTVRSNAEVQILVTVLKYMFLVSVLYSTTYFSDHYFLHVEHKYLYFLLLTC